MKNLSIYLCLLIGVFLSWSCEEESNMDEVGNWEISAPVPTTPTSGSSLLLDENLPNTEVAFEWEPAVTSNEFGVAYRFLLVEAASADNTNPIMEIVPGNNGKDRIVKPTATQIDYALAAKCYPAGASVEVKWVVVGQAIEKQAETSTPITIKRFDTEIIPTTLFITGAGAEAGEDVANATPMRAQLDADGAQTGVFDVYTTLNEGQTFSFRDQANAMSLTFGAGEGDNVLGLCGTAITAPASGQYRVTVDVINNTYSLWKVEMWSLVGDAVLGGWGGDVPLTYKGNGVWEAQLEFFYPYEGAGFIFRANGDWGYIIKQIKGTAAADGRSGKVIMESEATGAGVELEDSKIVETGMQIVTLDLSAYTFNIVPAPVDPGANQPIIGKSTDPAANVVMGSFLFGDYDAPAELYLLSEGAVVGELTLDGDKFVSKYLALEASKVYTLNSASDGSGTVYNDIGNGDISVDHDQAYTITVDFAEGKLSWKHYNLKVFHWDEVGGGWEQRTETPMTYTHPYKFEATADLHSGFHTKFNSPWEVQFGTSGTALTGTMQNVDPGPNFAGIVSDGTYACTIVVADDYLTGEYTFVKQ